MRKDMYKVIVERPRHWKSGDEEAARRRDDLEGPTHLGMRVGYGYRALNENLAPLRRYLLSQVGRPWNKVFSEICMGIDRRSTVQQHIHQHIDDFIAINVGIRDGQLVDLGDGDVLRYGTMAMHQELFVDPRSGLIRINKEYRDWRSRYAEEREREQAQLDARRRVVNERTVLLRLDELWFEVMLAELPATRVVVRIVNGQRKEKMVVESRYDVVLRRKTSRSMYEDSTERKRCYGSCDLYAVSKRQLSKREMKAQRLRE